MINEIYNCPKCGRPLTLNKSTNILTCYHWDGYTTSLASFLLQPDIKIELGKTKSNGRIQFLINSTTKRFAIRVEKNKILNSNICNYGPYDIEYLLDVQVYQNENVIYQIKNSVAPMIAGGALFGSLGAVAGSMVSNQKQKVKRQIINKLFIKINDVKIPSLYIETSDTDLVYKFINAIELLK